MSFSALAVRIVLAIVAVFVAIVIVGALVLIVAPQLVTALLAS